MRNFEVCKQCTGLSEVKDGRFFKKYRCLLSSIKVEFYNRKGDYKRLPIPEGCKCQLEQDIINVENDV